MGNVYRENKHLLPVETVSRVEHGGLMSDQECMSFLRPILDTFKSSWILDGVPRTVGQVVLAIDLADVVFSIHVHSEEELINRMQARWFHERSGRTFSPFSPSQIPGIDDETGEPLTKRADDDIHVFKKRLQGHYSTIDDIELVLGDKLKIISGKDSNDNYELITQMLLSS